MNNQYLYMYYLPLADQYCYPLLEEAISDMHLEIRKNRLYQRIKKKRIRENRFYKPFFRNWELKNIPADSEVVNASFTY